MRVFGLGAAAGMAALVACSVVNSPDDPAPAAGEGAGAGTAEGCPEGFEACSGACVNIAIDPQNCGACGNGCGDGEVCGVSQCLSECPEGTTDCDGSCVDLMSALSHCGECGNACTGADNQTASCSAGACAVACDSGFDDCDGDPINGCEQAIMADDINNCGECGNVCVAEEHATAACNAGTCAFGACEADWGDCDTDTTNGCETDLRETDEHCTACNTPCLAGLGAGLCEDNECKTARAFSDSYINNSPPTGPQCTNFTNYRASLAGGTYTAITVRNNLGGERTCDTQSAANQICNALVSGAAFNVMCDGLTWGVGDCSGVSVELWIGASCNCFSDTSLRGCYNNENWGGVASGNTCGQATQTIEILCYEE